MYLRDIHTASMTGWATSHKFVCCWHASIIPSRECIGPRFHYLFSQYSTDFRNLIKNVHIQIMILKLSMIYLLSSFIFVKSSWKSWTLLFKYTILTLSFSFWYATLWQRTYDHDDFEKSNGMSNFCCCLSFNILISNFLNLF